MKGDRFCYCQSTWESSRRFMLQCDACKEWFHGDCLRPSISEEDALRFARFHCPECTVLSGPSIERQLVARAVRETRTMIDYNEATSLAQDEHKYAKLLRAKRFAPNRFPYVNGDTVSLEWLRRTGMRDPFLIEDPEGLDMRMPPASLTVDQVADACGRDMIVEAMEVLSQQDKQMTLDEWAKYFTQPPEKRKRLLNVISLEIGSTKLAQMIQRPRIVRELDWTETVWPPRNLKPEFPRVQLYCLMSVKDCYTDFHIDFGGSSVFYHLLSGEKHFYFVRPTPVNLKKYEKWSSSPDQSTTFFGDEVKECVEVRITAGNTMIIPTGWIHAVYTPKDSIVIGGNFLQGMNIGGQFDCYEVENRTNVPLKFRYPYFVQMQWFAAKHYLTVLKSNSQPQNDPYTHSAHPFSKWEIEGLRRLADFLINEIKLLNDTRLSDAKTRRRIRENIPSELKNVAKMVQNLRSLVVKEQVRIAASEMNASLAGMAAEHASDEDDGDEGGLGALKDEVLFKEDEEEPENDSGDQVVIVGESKFGRPIKLKLKSPNAQPQKEAIQLDREDDGADLDHVSEWNSDDSEAEVYDDYQDVDDDEDEDAAAIDDPDESASDNEQAARRKRKRDGRNGVEASKKVSMAVPMSFKPLAVTASNSGITPHMEVSLAQRPLPTSNVYPSNTSKLETAHIKKKLAPQPSEATKQALAAAKPAPPKKKKMGGFLGQLLAKSKKK
ncbi:JmjC domain-containing histone demethylation protein 1 [Chytriomyces hyalinus]|nr:JmjC domain-containing histone demethylation protein 1 [Chytriomyces hyalinus]